MKSQITKDHDGHPKKIQWLSAAAARNKLSSLKPGESYRLESADRTVERGARQWNTHFILHENGQWYLLNQENAVRALAGIPYRTEKTYKKEASLISELYQQEERSMA
jgi:hypothetical protein